MSESLEIVDGLTFSDELKRVYCPDQEMKDRDGNGFRLPRYFYEIPEW